eukprot:1946508-Lingulodinium_polyedra.AAC.1
MSLARTEPNGCGEPRGTWLAHPMHARMNDGHAKNTHVRTKPSINAASRWTSEQATTCRMPRSIEQYDAREVLDPAANSEETIEDQP